ncbi:glucose-6-phosphate isomerase [Limibaculum sp. M0105]|uniref:Glucose-6-phosphate isomerase n=2 Tax=Thermohalobaculum xanthum TaxID=2753746 RepID=A0A8J7M704_9RHOB|nr:glucose-6-phosphate isomerase [Thermohalobaculum xanthum]MBK0399709.1 glucose-6-phosphate isomerase [Thermohalobaculum xanthum]
MSMTDAWAAVDAAAARLRAVHLRDLFAGDPGRFGRLSWQLDDLTIDFSKEKLDAAAIESLVALARAAGVEALRDRMVAGEPVNLTERRAVLHMALRGGADAPAGDDVAGTLDRFLGFAEAVRAGKVAGSGGPFTDVVNIGIGGSDLGPVMAARALSPDRDGPRLHFVSNVDGAHFADTVAALDPARTLVIVSSKTFTTLETMANARLARDWLGRHAAAQMAAVSTNIAGCAAFGIPQARVFSFWDWVGGRYSLWSAIGLSLAIGIGAEGFRALLAGAQAMDRHFREAPLERNLPVLLALVGIWRRNAMGWPTVALIPYDQRLERFPAYVQQLDMESNGKRVRRDGTPVATATGPVIWGEPGTNAQHSFFQLLHQGTDIVPVDFIAAARPRAADAGHHALLLANCLAQGQALAFGRTAAEVEAEMRADGKPEDEIARLAPHRTFPGDRPSTTILFRELDPFALGRLIALFEHKVFVQGAVWGVNSYDQWGVELGKALAGPLIAALRDGTPAEADASTRGLLARVRELGR